MKIKSINNYGKESAQFETIGAWSTRIVLYCVAIGVGIHLLTRDDINFKHTPQVQHVDSIYNSRRIALEKKFDISREALNNEYIAKKDSLNNAHRVTIDSLRKAYNDSLENKLGGN